MIIQKRPKAQKVFLSVKIEKNVKFGRSHFNKFAQRHFFRQFKHSVTANLSRK